VPRTVNSKGLLNPISAMLPVSATYDKINFVDGIGVWQQRAENMAYLIFFSFSVLVPRMQ